MLDYNQYMICRMALLKGFSCKGLASHWGVTLVLFSFSLIALFTARGTYMSAQVFCQTSPILYFYKFFYASSCVVSHSSVVFGASFVSDF